jgi:hypothetical protein
MTGVSHYPAGTNAFQNVPPKSQPNSKTPPPKLTGKGRTLAIDR